MAHPRKHTPACASAHMVLRLRASIRHEVELFLAVADVNLLRARLVQQQRQNAKLTMRDRHNKGPVARSIGAPTSSANPPPSTPPPTSSTPAASGAPTAAHSAFGSHRAKDNERIHSPTLLPQALAMAARQALPWADLRSGGIAHRDLVGLRASSGRSGGGVAPRNRNATIAGGLQLLHDI